MAQAYIVVGLGFGDEGKGSMVDYLCRLHQAKLVVRFNGGPQAGHTVVLRDGRQHTFSQFGSGSFIPGVRTHLSKYMLIEPWALLNEFIELKKKGVNASEHLTIDENCVVITPYHWIANRIQEHARGNSRHGSCGMGVGAAREDQVNSREVLFAKDLISPNRTLAKLRGQYSRLQPVLDELTRGKPFRDLYEQFVDESENNLVAVYLHFARGAKIVSSDYLSYELQLHTAIFEGAQGVLLDENHGFAPYNTWTNTTFENAKSLCFDAGMKDNFVKVGVLRAYSTRHGAGPFVSESQDQKFRKHVLENEHNVRGPWQGSFRVGHFDAVMTRYALRVTEGVDELALTHCDKVVGGKTSHEFHYLDSYETPNNTEIKELTGIETETMFVSALKPGKLVRYPNYHDAVQQITKRPITYVSGGPTAEDKHINQV